MSVDILGDLYLQPDEFGSGDLVFISGGAVCDNGLQTAVYISLFTDAEDADGRTDQRGGYWGDATDDYGSLGSRLWTLAREKMDSSISSRAQKYCEEALQWMLDDGVASAVSVAVSRTGLYSLAIEITLTKPDSSAETFAYAYNWSSQASTGY